MYSIEFILSLNNLRFVCFSNVDRTKKLNVHTFNMSMHFHKNSIVYTRMLSIVNFMNEPISKPELVEITKKNVLILSMISRNNALPGRSRVFSHKKSSFSIQISGLSSMYVVWGYILFLSSSSFSILSLNIYYSNKTNKHK